MEVCPVSVKRYSHQRELIYQAVRASREHPTAEMVYQQLKPANPNLSLGTVYRNLNLLTEEGLLTRMSFQVDRYDAVTRPHTHFHCEKCGSVVDLDLFDENVPYLADLDRKAHDAQPGLRIDRHDLVFYGLCPACAASHETS